MGVLSRAAIRVAPCGAARVTPALPTWAITDKPWTRSNNGLGVLVRCGREGAEDDVDVLGGMWWLCLQSKEAQAGRARLPILTSSLALPSMPSTTL